MDRQQMLDAVAEQRLRLAETLDGLADADWNTPSLCAGWRVREVVAHLVSILEIPVGRFVLNAVKAGSFDTYADRVAQQFGQRDPAQLAAAYRSLATTRFAPPVVGPIAPLTDVYVHTRDIERVVGRSSTLPADGQRVVLAYLCGGKARGFVSPRRTKGLRFEASDLAWSLGAGPTVSGTGEAIMLAVTGRTAALGELAGDGVAVLAGRLAG
jgi:uncharacterized protein (TIGR03083 family)